MTPKLPRQRWQIASPPSEQVSQLTQTVGLSPLMAQVVVNRGLTEPELAKVYLEPEISQLPPPTSEFPDLVKSVDLLIEAIATGEKIAICGDYDADGMTSTALLLRALRHLGAKVTHAIPSRMKDGYGINERIVTEFAQEGVGLILTVDNGISAYKPVLLAVELGITVIITDHHEVPTLIPPADAILNPKLIREDSPYRGVAGVGVAYILALATAERLGSFPVLADQLLELFTLGTIADLAPLTGVNRRWLKKGLRLLPQSQLLGVQAMLQVAGISEKLSAISPDDIGFRLGPRINAVGRISDPQIVIELLTTEDAGVATTRASQCEEINRRRQEFCQQIEAEAIALIENTPLPWYEQRVLLIVQNNWHHGVIGIVASRLVERYGVPVFIGTYEEKGENIRGSARGVEEFNVFHALEYCDAILSKYGGHKAAGGFSLPAENLELFNNKLVEFAQSTLKEEHTLPLIKIDTLANLRQINLALTQEIDSLQPWGIGNEFPVFWSPNLRVIEQKIVGKNHIKLTLGEVDQATIIKAIAWNWGEYFPLPPRLDVAYKVKNNLWQGQSSIQLDLVGVRLPSSYSFLKIDKRDNSLLIGNKCPTATKKAKFQFQGRVYFCSYWGNLKELRIKNEQGKVLAVLKGEKTGLIGKNRKNAQPVNVTQPPYYQIIKTACQVLELP